MVFRMVFVVNLMLWMVKFVFIFWRFVVRLMSERLYWGILFFFGDLWGLLVEFVWCCSVVWCWLVFRVNYFLFRFNSYDVSGDVRRFDGLGINLGCLGCFFWCFCFCGVWNFFIYMLRCVFFVVVLCGW